MTLETKLAAAREASAKRIPTALQSIMLDATERLRASGIMPGIVKQGAPAPHFALDDQNGRTVALAALLAAGPVVISVFRGFW